ncbi:MAG: dTDP-4-dehydrorhamnose 3,5-epimerase [Schlesneria sp.]
MKIIPTEISGLVLVEPKAFGDARGFFFESFQINRYRDAGITENFVQDNVSRSSKGILRGLHYQLVQPQGKLVYVTRGEVFDVAVDLRRSSPTFGRWFGVLLNDENHRQLYVPPGFAHGFCVTSETADFCYKCTDLYNPTHERTLLWNDPAIGIDWPISDSPLLSAKDQQGRLLADLETYP